MTSPRFNGRRFHGLARGFRSGLEEKIADQLSESGVEPRFEQDKLEYEVPERTAKYTPDFPVIPGKLIIETKGRFTAEDRKKMLLVKAAHPHVEFRLVFNNSNARLYKGSPTTYASWCRKYGFPFADKAVPEAWIREIKAHVKTKQG